MPGMSVAQNAARGFPRTAAMIPVKGEIKMKAIIIRGGYFIRPMATKVSAMVVSAVALLSLCALPANAGFNVSGVTCQNYNASEVTDIDYLTFGVRNINAATRFVICAAPPHGPAAAGDVFAVFVLFGQNSVGASTTCTLYSYNSSGGFLGASTITNSNTTMVDVFTLPVAQVPVDASVSVLCSLPGSGRGVITQIASVR
jgi:hypothetical protein